MSSKRKIKNLVEFRKKECFVPTCGNTSDNNIKKIFVLLPRRPAVRLEWFLAVNRKYTSTTYLYCCEDHFDLKTDLRNWMQFKLLGNRMLLHKNVIPHLFIDSPIPENRKYTSQLSDSDKQRKKKSFEEYMKCKPYLNNTSLKCSHETEKTYKNSKHVKTAINDGLASKFRQILSASIDEIENEILPDQPEYFNFTSAIINEKLSDSPCSLKTVLAVKKEDILPDPEEYSRFTSESPDILKEEISDSAHPLNTVLVVKKEILPDLPKFLDCPESLQTIKQEEILSQYYESPTLTPKEEILTEYVEHPCESFLSVEMKGMPSAENV